MESRRTDPFAAAEEALLEQVQRPHRYLGGEWNQVVKDHARVDVTFALAYPDVYEIGMSHLGFRILYALLNAREDTAAERVFCPWPDMADGMRARGIPLRTLESGTPLRRMDIVGFSLQYEMTFTNVLEMLDLSGIPLRSSRRDDEDPLVVAGGPVVFNVEPLADFLDLVLVGDGEALLPEFLDTYRRLKARRASRAEMIRRLAAIEGVYAPALYPLERESGHGLMVPVDGGEAPYPVRRRLLLDLDAYPFPEKILVPHGEIVHDRVSVELMRGCPVGCRFCQAGYIYRPTRERDPNQVRDAVVRSVRDTGYDSFGLTSLNTGEYGDIHRLLFDLMERFEPQGVSVSLGSLHASTMTPELAEQVKRVRKSGFTIAPEAGTQRLRNVINKNLDERQILEACRLAFEAGWKLIKLYFMIGLPTETDADVDGLVDLAHEILEVGRRTAGHGARIHLSASSFVPKAVTPFQWLGMDRRENLYRKQDRIAARVRRGVRFKHHECETSFLEAVFSRGDRRLGEVLEHAWRRGARFDGWSEHFRKEAWSAAFAASGLDPETIAHGDWDPAWRLPWDVIHPLVNRKWLELELKRALAEGTLSVCGPTDCHGCAPFARDCVQGLVRETTGRRLIRDLPLAPASPEAGRPGDAQAVVPAEGSPPARESEAPRYRYRARYRKQGRLRFLGHLDLQKTLMRGMRRAGVPLVYSSGFNPRPRVSPGPALAVGIASEAEYVDFETTRPVDVDRLRESLNQSMPVGLVFTDVRELRGSRQALMATIRAVRYRVEGAGAEAVAAAAAKLRGGGAIPVERVRKGVRRSVDLRDELVDWELLENGRGLRLTLKSGSQGGSIKAREAVQALLGDTRSLTITREEQWVRTADAWVPAMETGSSQESDPVHAQAAAP